MRIAIIVDGLESTRQINADGGEFLLEACEEVLWGKDHVQAEVFKDRQVDALLSSIDVSDCACIVFASNSLRHPDSAVTAAVQRHKTEIHNYVAAGGGMVVLHQFVSGEFPLSLPEGLDVRLRRRETGVFQPVLFVDEDDSMCRLPHDLRTTSLLSERADRISSDGYWKALDEKHLRGFQVSARASNGDAVLAFGSVGNGGRVVVCSAPLDWHAQHEPIVNIVQFATTGKPDFVIWESLSQSTSTFVAALRNLPESWEVPLEGGSHDTVAWLKGLGATHVMSEEQLTGSTAAADSPLAVALPPQAHALSVRILPDRSVRITNNSRSRSHEFASRFFSTLRSENDLWPTVLQPFPTRNIVVAAEYFCQRHSDMTFAWDPRRDATLRHRSTSLIFEAMTLTSTSAVAQTLAAIDPTSHRLDELFASQESLMGNPDEHLLMSAFRTLGGDQTVRDFLMTGVLPHMDTMSPSAALRALDWVSYFHFNRKLDVEPAAARLVGEKLLTKASSTEQHGLWESIEGTASGVLGAAALFDVCNEFEFLRSVASPLVRLRTEYEISAANDVQAFSMMARIAHALAVAEDSGPLGIDVLTDRAPRRLWSADSGQERRIRQSEQLVARFSESNRQVQEELADAKQLEHDRRWVRITGTTFCWIVLLAATAVSLAGVAVIARSSDIASVWLVPLALGAVTALHFALRVFERWRILPRRFITINRSLERPIRRRLGLD